ncbi:MAG: hypothetical protein HY078_10405 [Elusimicrobia bacterium]|nr:hypothetical protein [Elusimicrobiota bacterium]
MGTPAKPPQEIAQSQKFTSAQATALVEATEGKIAAVQQKLKDVNWLLIAITLVMFVAMVGLFVAVDAMLIESFRTKANSYHDLVERINKQTDTIKDLSQEIERLRGQLAKPLPPTTVPQKGHALPQASGKP